MRSFGAFGYRFLWVVPGSFGHGRWFCRVVAGSSGYGWMGGGPVLKSGPVQPKGQPAPTKLGTHGSRGSRVPALRASQTRAQTINAEMGTPDRIEQLSHTADCHDIRVADACTIPDNNHAHDQHLRSD